MLQFVVDPSDPIGALEDCGTQLDMLTDLLSQGGSGGIDLGDMGAAGLADLLRAVSRAMNTIGGIIRRVCPAGLEIIEREAEAQEREGRDARQNARRQLLARLLAEETDPSETLSGRDLAGGGETAMPAPRLTEPRQRIRRAA